MGHFLLQHLRFALSVQLYRHLCIHVMVYMRQEIYNRLYDPGHNLKYNYVFLLSNLARRLRPFGIILKIYPIYLFLCGSISKSSMYQLLQPRLDVLLFEIIFPLMCFNDNDQRLWDEDPHEYVRKGYGEFYGLFCLRKFRFFYYW